MLNINNLHYFIPVENRKQNNAMMKAKNTIVQTITTHDR